MWPVWQTLVEFVTLSAPTHKCLPFGKRFVAVLARRRILQISKMKWEPLIQDVRFLWRRLLYRLIFFR